MALGGVMVDLGVLAWLLGAGHPGLFGCGLHGLLGVLGLGLLGFHGFHGLHGLHCLHGLHFGTLYDPRTEGSATSQVTWQEPGFHDQITNTLKTASNSS